MEIMMLAVRAVAMTAGMRHPLLMFAFRAVDQILGLACVRQCLIAASA